MRKSMMMILGMFVVFTLYACSNDDTSSDDGNTNKDGEENKNSEDQVTLSIGLPGGYSLTSEEIIDGFRSENPNINVEVQEDPWGEFVTKIATKIAGDTAPDIWFQESMVTLGYGERGVADDLTSYIEEDLNEDDYIDALYASQTPNGEIYGIPHGINPIALAYNKTIFEEAGVPFPTDDWTYDDLIEVAQELTQDTNGDGKTDIYGFDARKSMTTAWYPWTKAAGGQILDESLTKANFTDPKTVEGITAWADMFHKYEVSPDQNFIEAAGGTDNAFGEGKVAMLFMQYSTHRQMTELFPDTDYDTVQIPKAFNGEDRFVPMVVNSWLIYSKAEEASKDAAWEFLKYYLSEEAQTIFTESFASLPVEKGAIAAVEEMKETRPENKAAYTIGIEESGVTLDENPTWAEWSSAAQQVFNDMRDGLITPEEGLKEAEERVQEILDEG